MYARFNGIVFRRQTVCVKAYREKHVVALKSSLARYHLKTRICLDVTYVHTGSARIGKFHKSVKFRLIGIVNGVENALLFPFFLPLAFNMLKIVFHLFHPFAV